MVIYIKNIVSLRCKFIVQTLLNDKKNILVEKIRNLFIEVIYHSEEAFKTNYLDYLSKKLNYKYGYILRIFSKTQRTLKSKTEEISNLKKQLLNQSHFEKKREAEMKKFYALYEKLQVDY